MITFVCPNGHKLTCPDERMGRTARCPSCAAVFRVPTQNGVAATTTEPRTPRAPQPEVRIPVGQIVFLCPNGHRLFGPPSLEGRGGQCPHCGSKFLIPKRDAVPDAGLAAGDPGEAEPVVHVEHLAEPTSAEGPFVHGTGVQPLDLRWLQGTESHPVAAQTVEMAQAETWTEGGEPEYYMDEQPAHALAEIFSELWRSMTHGNKLELVLENGEVIVPERFASGWSRQSHGLFAVREASGSYTMVAVPWDYVKRLNVRGVDYLPSGVFE